MIICAWIVFIYSVISSVINLTLMILEKEAIESLKAFSGLIIGVLTCYVAYSILF